MALRWEFTRDGRFQIPYKVEIYDDQYSGASTDLGTVGGTPVEVTVGTKNADPLEKVKGSSITVRLWGQQGDFDALFDRNNTRFKIKLYVNGAFESEFVPVPDTFTDYVAGGSFTNEIQAANLALLKQKDVDGVVSDGSRYQAIQDILDVYFDLTLWDGSVFYTTEASTGGSSLAQVNIQASRLEGMNCYQALEMLIPKGHQIRITKGKAIIVPVTEASFTAYTSSGSSQTFDDNFVSTAIGGRLAKPRTRLVTYDGVRRIYEPLDADNIVPSGDFELEDFGLEELTSEDGETQALPTGWTKVRSHNAFTTYAALNGSDVSWKIGESIGTFTEQTVLEASGLDTYQSWTAEVGQVLAGTRLKIKFTHNYQSVNGFAHIPIKIRVGGYVLFRGRNNSGGLVAGQPEWRSASQGLLRHVDHVLIGTRANTGYSDWEFVTPPIPVTDTLTVEVETPSVDRSWESGNNFLEIAEFSIDPANESGEILEDRKVLAGSEGDVYEYTEGFGDGFSAFNPGALFVPESEISFTPKSENLTDFWIYNGNDVNVPSTQLPLAELETKYLYSQLSTDRDRIHGTLDIYDFLALIDGYRVNYIKTDFRYGRSDTELIEIRDHDLEATIEDRKKKKDVKVVGVVDVDDRFWNYNQMQAIGELAEDISDEERTAALIDLDVTVRKGFEYWVVNENEVSREDRLAGIYPIRPIATDGMGNKVLETDPGYDTATKEYGPGPGVSVPIETTIINAPKGSIVLIAPGQREIENNIIDQRVTEGEEAIETLNTVTLPALQSDLDQLNNVTIPAIQSDLDDLNNTQLPNLQSQLDTLDGYFDDPSTIPAGYNFFPGIVTAQAFIDTFVANDGYVDNLIANNAFVGKIVSNMIVSGAVNTLQLAADAVTANKIGAGEIATFHLGANVVTANKIDVADLYATDATIGATLNIGSNGEFNLANVVHIAQGVDSYQGGGDKVLIGTTAGGTPYVRAQNSTSNYVQMVGVANTSNNFFEVKSNGNVVFSVDGSGANYGGPGTVFDDVTINGTLTMGAGGEIVGSNYTLNNGGLTINSSANFDITLGSSGEITNSNSDFTINQNGMRVQAESTGTLTNPERSYSVYDGGTLRGALWGTPGDMRLTSEGNLLIGPTSDTNRTDILNGYFRLPLLSSNPSSPLSGAMYYNSSLDEIRLYNGTNWYIIDMTQV